MLSERVVGSVIALGGGEVAVSSLFDELAAFDTRLHEPPAAVTAADVKQLELRQALGVL